MKHFGVASALLTALALTPTVNGESITLGSKEYEINRVTDIELCEGVQYINFTVPDYGYSGANVFVTIADLTKPNVKIETITGKGAVKGLATLSKMAEDNSYEGHQVVAGANANFWVTTEYPWSNHLYQSPWGAAVRNGVLITEPNIRSDMHWEGPTVTGSICIGDDGKAYIERHNLQFRVYNERMGWLETIHNCNKFVHCGQMGLYNEMYPSDEKFRSIDDVTSDWALIEGRCTEVLMDFEPSSGWSCGEIMYATVKEIRPKAGLGTRGNHDLALVGSDAYAMALNQFQIGDRVRVQVEFQFEKSGTVPVQQAVGGNSMVFIEGTYNKSKVEQYGYNTSNYARTVYGATADRNKLITVVCESVSGRATGLTTRMMGQIAMHFGATNVSQVDCGGSAQMWANGSQVSRSTDAGGVRSVVDGFFIIDTSDRSGIENVTKAHPKSAVRGVAGGIEIDGEFATATVYGIDGRKIASSSERQISLSRGLYIVSVDQGKAVKVSVR